jgi:hypothetical protein
MTATTTRRPNTYAGTCRNCHRPVRALTGYLGPKVDGRWTVEHTTCFARSSSPVVQTTRTTRTARPTRRQRSCISGGNCSSFGTGRGCGAEDCDGY